uniref:Uncharacterized protein n=1 Tax=Aegilops tauschii subsp. strangulata TaxID=200361 RepID=A0A453CIF6_AEGTS
CNYWTGPVSARGSGTPAKGKRYSHTRQASIAPHPWLRVRRWPGVLIRAIPNPNRRWKTPQLHDSAGRHGARATCAAGGGGSSHLLPRLYPGPQRFPLLLPRQKPSQVCGQ